ILAPAAARAALAAGAARRAAACATCRAATGAAGRAAARACLPTTIVTCATTSVHLYDWVHRARGDQQTTADPGEMPHGWSSRNPRAAVSSPRKQAARRGPAAKMIRESLEFLRQPVSEKFPMHFSRINTSPHSLIAACADQRLYNLRRT